MHGCDSGSALLVNAEVDSMGGVVDGGVGIGVKTSPRRAAIEKAQAELRQEYDVREERRRELEFLEKGGNPLDFKFGYAASVSVQSTSLTDQQAEHFVTSEAKGSFALTASPHGDSVESSGRPGVPAVCEPHSADNLLLFDGENEVLESERNSKHLNKRNSVAPSEQSSQMDGTQNAKESEDSAIFRPYARRNRSKINRDSARSSSTDMVQSRAGHGSSLPAHGGPKDAKGSIPATNSKKDQNILSVSNTKSATPNGDLVSKKLSSDNQLNMESNNVQVTSTSISKGDLPECKLDTAALKSLRDGQPKEPAQDEAHKSPTHLAFEEPDHVGGKEQVIETAVECLSGVAVRKPENENNSGKLNGFSEFRKDGKTNPIEGQSINAATVTKGLDSESSCTQNSLSIDVNNDNDVCFTKNVDSNGKPLDQASELEGRTNLAGGEMVNEKIEIKAVDNSAGINDNNETVHQSHSLTDSVLKVEGEYTPDVQNEVSYPSSMEGVKQNDHTVPAADRKVSNVLSDNCNSSKENLSTSKPKGTMDMFICELPGTTLLQSNNAAAADPQTGPDINLKLTDKAHEDSILEEARIIEAKRKRIAELSVGTLPMEHRRKSHWDFVLEEMAWLANDFAQERLWKLTAAAQICRRVAFTSRLRFEEQNQRQKLKKVAFSLANAVMQFWHSAQELLDSEDASFGPKTHGRDLVGSSVVDGNEVSEYKTGELDKDAGNELEQQCASNKIQRYALRFLKYNSFPVPSLQAEAPATPDRICDSGTMELSWDEHLTEESLFYAVPSGAMEAYRKSIESYLVQTEKTGSSLQEEVETSAYDTGAEFGYHDSAYDDDEGETSAYYLPGAFDGSKSSKANQKRRKNSIKSYTSRPYEMGADLPYGISTVGSQSSMLMGKRPPSTLNVSSIPTKRVRTGSRQRVLSPFGAAAVAAVLQAPAKTDASSGDTNSFQDDQSTLNGGSQIQRSMEVDSTGDFEKQLPYDCAETPTKPKKKKKAKHLVRRNTVLTDTGDFFVPRMGSAYDQGWQLESTIHNDQRDYSRKRLESHHFDSNGSSGLYGQQNAKKPKIMKQQLDNAFDITPSGSVPSPVASQMSNMSNPNKFMKLIGARDRGRKSKGPKISASQPGSGSPWSLFEDQALVVLVHDMGPNWELVSDAINSTLQFKCIFRKPKECRERHKILMDRNSDGADSADDSGSSQSYPSTLPGIPKGSARQLFQRLQGPMEEDTLKSHFEKIIMIGKKQHYRRCQNENQDVKQIVPVHNSHVIQVCPNNLNGGFLTPLDLCDVTTSQDVLSLGYQASHSSGLAIPSQGAVGSIHPASVANSSIQGPSGMVIGSNLSSPSASLNASVRDGRYGVPRTTLPADEQQRMQQFNQMLSARNIQQSNLSVPGAISAADRGVRILPGGNGMGVVCGINRSMPMSRPGFPGMASSSMLSSGGMLSSSMVPSSVNMHTGPGSGQGNSILRPRDAMHLMRPGHNPEHQRQLMVPELQMQATQGPSPGIPAFNGLSSGFPNQTTPSPSQTYPGHPQQQQQQQQHQMSSQQPHAMSNSHHPHIQGPNHATGSQQQAYAIRIAKERQMHQQRLLQQQQQQQQQQPQQQQQFATSGALMSHVQPQSQLPISSSLQNSSQIQSQTSSQPVSMPSLTPSSPMTPISLQHQQKHHLPPHGLSRNPQSGSTGLTNQMGKQRQRQQQQQQQFQQSGRNHPQQRQQTQSQQQAKILKGMGRGNMLVHQNLSVDPSHINGLPLAPGNQAADKGEQIMHLMQGQGLYSGSGMSPVQPPKSHVSPQTSNLPQKQQKPFAGPTQPSKQHQQMPSHSDNSTQGQVPAVPSGNTSSDTHQAILPAVVSSNHQHLQLQPQQHQKQGNQTQPNVQRMLQPNRQVSSDLPIKSQADQQAVSNASQMSASANTAMPQACIGPTSSVPIVSSAASTQWKATEPVYDSNVPNMASQGGSVGSAPLSNSAGSDQVPSVSQGLGQRQLSGGLPHNGHNVGAQWQQHSQLQQSSTSLPPTSQHYQQQEQEQLQSQQQVPLQQQSQQQTQHLTATQGSLYHRPSNSKIE